MYLPGIGLKIRNKIDWINRKLTARQMRISFLNQNKDGYVGDGVTCRLSQKASMEKTDKPVGGLAMPSRNPNPDGTDISIYSKLAPGECSVMGFEWENQEKLLKTMKWSKEPELYSNMATQVRPCFF